MGECMGDWKDNGDVPEDTLGIAHNQSQQRSRL